jgi:hypothetical protein
MELVGFPVTLSFFFLFAFVFRVGLGILRFWNLLISAWRFRVCVVMGRMIVGRLGISSDLWPVSFGIVLL